MISQSFRIKSSIKKIRCFLQKSSVDQEEVKLNEYYSYLNVEQMNLNPLICYLK